MIRRTTAFTLIEIMLAVLLLAIVAGMVSFSFSRPLQSARGQNAIDQLRDFDLAARQQAIATGRIVRVVFDLGAAKLYRRDGIDLQQIRAQGEFPPGFHIAEARIAGAAVREGEAMVDISSSGWSRSYVLHVQGPGMDQWILFCGLTGEMTQVSDEKANQIFEAPGNDAH